MREVSPPRPRNGVVATRPEVGFHLTARRTLAADFQDHRADADAAPFQGVQIDPTGYEVSPQQLRRNIRPPEKGGDRRHILGGDQRDLTRAVALRVVAIPLDSLLCNQQRRRRRNHRRQTEWSKADPHKATRPDGAGKQLRNRRLRRQRSQRLPRWCDYFFSVGWADWVSSFHLSPSCFFRSSTFFEASSALAVKAARAAV